jgi:hypothetical protein
MISFWVTESAENLSPAERRTSMAMNVCWVSDLDKAREVARKVNKPVLLDFFNPK